MGVAANELERATPLVAVILLGIAIVGLLWWSYFSWVQQALEEALRGRVGAKQAALARDAYSFAHFLIIFGIVAFATGLEGAVEHPGEPIQPAELALLITGVSLFVIATAGAYWRATRDVLGPRLIVVAAIAVVVWLGSDATAPWILAIVALGLAVIVAIEQIGLNRGLRVET